MKTMIQAAVVTLFATSAAHAQQAVQWRVEDGGNGHWYVVDFEFRLWASAESYARSIGGHLATTTSQAELDFIRPFITNTFGADYWLGASRQSTASPWLWVTAEPFTFTRWEPGAPDDGLDSLCLEVVGRIESAGFGMWNDEAFYAWGPGNYSVIEWSADCNGDGIVDYGQCRDGSLPDYNGNNVPDCCEAGTPCAAGNYPVQWRVADGGNGHWYQLCPVGASPAWHACLSAAWRMGGTLACIGSAQEDAFVRSTQPGSPLWRDFGPWLGGFQSTGAVEPAGGWAWITGEPWTWAGWDSEPLGEPNNAGCGDGEENRLHYVACQGASPHWNDAPNSGLSSCCLSPMAVSSYVVEWSADCNADGIVDKGQILCGQLADVNADGVPDICQQPTCVDADFFRDFTVNGADLGILLSQWGPNTPLTVSDLNGDGGVDGADLGVFLSFWGACP